MAPGEMRRLEPDRGPVRDIAIDDDFLYWTAGTDGQILEPGLLQHSDRGSQYTSNDYQRVLPGHGIQCSMSGRGNLLGQRRRRELLRHVEGGAHLPPELGDRQEAATAIHEYIEVFYNRRRRHLTLAVLHPTKHERLYIGRRSRFSIEPCSSTGEHSRPSSHRVTRSTGNPDDERYGHNRGVQHGDLLAAIVFQPGRSTRRCRLGGRS